MLVLDDFAVLLSIVGGDYGVPVAFGVTSEFGKNRTLRIRTCSEWAKFSFSHLLALPPTIIAGEINMLPAER